MGGDLDQEISATTWRNFGDNPLIHRLIPMGRWDGRVSPKSILKEVWDALLSHL